MSFPNIGYNMKQLNDFMELYSTDFERSIDDSMFSDLNNLTNGFLRENFCQKINVGENHLKKMTIAIARSFIGLQKVARAGHNLQEIKYGLFYPTTKMTSEADNFAFLPDIIDKGFLSFQIAEWIKVLEIDDKVLKYQILDVAMDVNYDKLLWENLNNTYTITDTSEQPYFVKESDTITAFNSEGDIIKPDS